MNAHFHLIVNHLPIMAIPLVLIFLLVGYKLDNTSIKRLSLFALFALSILTIGIFLTGEPAEESIEHLPNVAEHFIESHEKASQVSLVLVLVMGVCSVIALKRDVFIKFVFVTGLIAFASLAYTGNLGGQIMHQEIRPK
jgi:uncharacterized membrane protein